MKYDKTVQLMKKTSRGTTYCTFCSFGMIKETPKNTKIYDCYSLHSQSTQDYIDSLLEKGYVIVGKEDEAANG